VDDAKIGEAAAHCFGRQLRGPTPLSVGLHTGMSKPFHPPATLLLQDFSFTIDPSETGHVAIGPSSATGRTDSPSKAPAGNPWTPIIRSPLRPGQIPDAVRAQGDKKISREGYAESPDGVTSLRNPNR